MIISILASTSQGGIGNRGTLPWPKHSEDLQWFKKHTEGHIVVMGRKTWEDPLMPKPLVNRKNFVVSSKILNPEHRHLAVWMRGNPAENIKELQKNNPEKNIFIIGGKTLYEACIPISERILLSRIKGNYFADTRINLDKILLDFRIKGVRPGNEATYEIWDRVWSV